MFLTVPQASLPLTGEHAHPQQSFYGTPIAMGEQGPALASSAHPFFLAGAPFSNLQPVCAGNVVLAAEIRVHREKYKSESVIKQTTDCWHGPHDRTTSKKGVLEAQTRHFGASSAPEG